MQRPRLSTEACDHAEDALDYLLDALADGTIDGKEADELTVRLANVVTVVSEVDEAVAETVAALRCGLDSPRVVRLRGERRSRIERQSAA